MTAEQSADGTEREPHPLAVDTGGGRLDDAEATAGRPLVTAVVTTYDRSELVKRAVESVFNQTYAPLEFLIIEDGTDSGVAAWLREAGHDSVRYVRHADNQGLAAARNTALALADGDYVAFLDDDDAWKPDRIERQVSLLASLSPPERSQVAVVYCGLESRQDGTVQSILHPENDGDLAASIRDCGASTVQSACLFRRAALLDVSGYDEELPSSIDHDIWMSLAIAGYEVRALDEPLVVSFDDFADSMMTNTDQRIRGVRMYVEKWRPTYREWFGPSAGDRYARRYFARVVGRLAATKFVTGQVDEAVRAARAIGIETDVTDYPYVFNVCAVMLAETGFKRVLPPRAVRLLARLVK
jgi:glycosyltransferase involved in cell wall biosynthesis